MSTLVCSTTDVPVGRARRFDVAGTAVAVVHTEDGFFAVADTCSHSQVSLAAGDVERRTIECWLHGSRFDLVTGQPSGPPAREPIPTYPVTVDGQSVLVSLPHAAHTPSGHREPEQP